MATARTIISLALEAMNRLSPGEILDADLAAACLRRLNVIADDWNVGRAMMPQDQLVSGAVTGQTITIGAGDFVALPFGGEIIQMQADGFGMDMITLQQYNNILVKSATGRPEVWVSDGAATIYIYPAAVGSTVSIMARVPFVEFADLDTDYKMPAGYKGAFAASLAVAMAPTLLGGLPSDLVAAEQRALFKVGSSTIRPAILTNDPLARCYTGSILRGWN